MTLKDGPLAKDDFLIADDILEKGLAGGIVSDGKVTLKIWRMTGPEAPASYSGSIADQPLIVTICGDRIFTWGNGDQIEKQGKASLTTINGVGSGVVTDIKTPGN